MRRKQHLRVCECVSVFEVYLWNACKRFVSDMSLPADAECLCSAFVLGTKSHSTYARVLCVQRRRVTSCLRVREVRICVYIIHMMLEHQPPSIWNEDYDYLYEMRISHTTHRICYVDERPRCYSRSLFSIRTIPEHICALITCTGGTLVWVCGFKRADRHTRTESETSDVKRVDMICRMLKCTMRRGVRCERLCGCSESYESCA